MSSHSWFVVDLILSLLAALCFLVNTVADHAKIKLLPLGLFFFVVISVIAFWRVA